MYCVIKCIVRGNQARVKNADLRHPSCTVVIFRRKSASPVRNVLRAWIGTNLAQEWDQRQVLVNMEINYRIPSNAENF